MLLICLIQSLEKRIHSQRKAMKHDYLGMVLELSSPFMVEISIKEFSHEILYEATN